ncbi:MAG: hypothetical protein ABFD03_04165 [Clostridiaceae bacterium]
MLKKLTKEDAAYAAERCWALFQDPRARCYPINTCREDMERSFAVFCDIESGTLLGYWSEDQLAGVCELYFEQETRYLMVNALYAWDDADTALDAFLAYIDDGYAGYEANVGAPPENTRLAGALTKHGYAMTETCFDLRYDAVSLTPEETTIQGISLLEDEEDDGFEEYAPLHDAWFPNDYWSSARMRELQGDWQAFTLRGNSGIEGSLIVLPGHNAAEVYALHAADEAMAQNLLTGMLQQNETAEYGVDEIVLMVQTANEAQLHAALACGFTLFGQYTGWKKTIE